MLDMMTLIEDIMAREMAKRGMSVDHTTVFRWVQRYAPELDKRSRPHLFDLHVRFVHPVRKKRKRPRFSQLIRPS